MTRVIRDNNAHLQAGVLQRGDAHGPVLGAGDNLACDVVHAEDACIQRKDGSVEGD